MSGMPGERSKQSGQRGWGLVISRRDFVGVGFGTAALLAGMGLTDALEPEVAEALTLPVQFTVGRRINYGNGGFTNEMRVNGNLAFCVNPSHYTPPSGSYDTVHDDVLWDSVAEDTHPDNAWGARQ